MPYPKRHPSQQNWERSDPYELKKAWISRNREMPLYGQFGRIIDPQVLQSQVFVLKHLTVELYLVVLLQNLKKVKKIENSKNHFFQFLAIERSLRRPWSSQIVEVK